jgi:hypothetical protein
MSPSCLPLKCSPEVRGDPIPLPCPCQTDQWLFFFRYLNAMSGFTPFNMWFQDILACTKCFRIVRPLRTLFWKTDSSLTFWERSSSFSTEPFESEESSPSSSSCLMVVGGGGVLVVQMWGVPVVQWWGGSGCSMVGGSGCVIALGGGGLFNWIGGGMLVGNVWIFR